VLPVSDGPLSTSIALKRRRGNSLSSPLSSPRERHTYAQLSPVNPNSPVNSPPPAPFHHHGYVGVGSVGGGGHHHGAAHHGGRDSGESPRTTLRNTLVRLRRTYTGLMPLTPAIALAHHHSPSLHHTEDSARLALRGSG
jgi:hypothetical protein